MQSGRLSFTEILSSSLSSKTVKLLSLKFDGLSCISWIILRRSNTQISFPEREFTYTLTLNLILTGNMYDIALHY